MAEVVPGSNCQVSPLPLEKSFRKKKKSQGMIEQMDER